jgi:dTDP-4-amino-4,6-dideoxygalactose transaminase
VNPFHDVAAQYQAHREEVLAAIQSVLDGGHYILGPAMHRFEEAFARYLSVRHVVGVSSGTAALELSLRALDIGLGDEVIVPALTAVATAMAVCSVGATPRVTDIEPDTYCLAPESLRREISPRTRAIIPVHLYGQCADMEAIQALAREHKLIVIEDAAQAHGAMYKGRHAGTMGRMGCFSFYPTKNLGAYGDAGAIATDDEDLAARLRRLRDYGKSGGYCFLEPGVNARLDDLHAAVLAAKLPHLDEWNEKRRAHAERYRQGIRNAAVRLPVEREGCRHVYHQFVVRCVQRDHMRAHLERCGVQTLIHYPAAIHETDALRGKVVFHHQPIEAETAVREIVSLPIYPELPPEHLDRVIEGVNNFDAE